METKKSPISKIAELRERTGLTQKELSKLVGVTESTIANWEKGRSGIDWIEKIIKLCKALDCDLESLIDYQTSEKEPSFEELSEMYRQGLLSKKEPTFAELREMYRKNLTNKKIVSNNKSK